VTGRTNDEWLESLARAGPARDGAVAELREVLRRGLGKALRGHPGADDAFLEDITQDAVLKVLDGLPSFRGSSKFTTWAIAVAVRVAFSELRRARWRDVSLGGLTEGGLVSEPVTQPATAARAERDELIALMRRVMNTDLTERQRFLLVAELDGVPQAELAARLGLNRNALYKLGHDARQKLKRGLLAAGVTEDDVRGVFEISS
jgi:RNA polymerase sigma-70 factor (ECF subfamily)